MFKAIKIALLYWLQQALRGFCPHDHHIEALRIHAPICPTCALARAIKNRLGELCGMQAIYKIPKCDLCFEPLSDRERGVHSVCAEREMDRDRRENFA
jgi:hypothetical protein